jgi:hypothetical protein
MEARTAAEQQRMAARLEAERAEREAQQQRMADILQYMQSFGAHTGLPVPPGLFAPPLTPPAATPVSMNIYCFRLCFACMTSTFLD